jgi:hypothetical protein
MLDPLEGQINRRFQPIAIRQIEMRIVASLDVVKPRPHCQKVLHANVLFARIKARTPVFRKERQETLPYAVQEPLLEGDPRERRNEAFGDGADFKIVEL